MPLPAVSPPPNVTHGRFAEVKPSVTAGQTPLAPPPINQPNLPSVHRPNLFEICQCSTVALLTCKFCVTKGLPSGVPGIGAFGGGDEAVKEKEALNQRLATLETKIRILEDTVSELQEAAEAGKRKPGCCSFICAKLCGCVCRRRTLNSKENGEAGAESTTTV